MEIKLGRLKHISIKLIIQNFQHSKEANSKLKWEIVKSTRFKKFLSTLMPLYNQVLLAMSSD